jgi:transposase-like protein
MTKFSIEEKVKGARLVEGGRSFGSVAQETGISHQVIRNTLRHLQEHGLEGLVQHRYNWTVDEKLAILRHMQKNHLSCSETSIQFGIKSSSTVWQWLQSYERYGVAGLEMKKRGRPKKWRPPDDTMTPLEKLEAENLYLRAENDYLKKLNALVAEREKRERESKQKSSRS